MDSSNWNRIETIVDEILEKNPEDWQTYIHTKYAGEPQEIISEVTKLLESIENSEGWLENSEMYRNHLLKEALPVECNTSLTGETFGSYIAEELIAEGGMGAVYLGKRTEGDFDHTVAIKVIKAGMNTPENIRRFNRERRILAGLMHEGIARLYDGGITDNHLPYLIMEYVDGVRIDDYCNNHQLTLSQRIDLFKKVLRAIRYAHENLVIHRDLKPGNILVTSSGNVKILDFGIATLLHDDHDAESPQHITRAQILTPKYAAPEQILQTAVTTASDIYTLGVILYILLADNHPFDADGLSPFEIEQKTLESELPKPSIRVQSVNQKKKIKGDLDAIVLKALRKRPENRYRTINEFLDDLERFQKNEPVSAVEANVSYRMFKFLKRNRRWAATAAASFILVIAFFGFYTHRVTQERNLAQQQLDKAEQISDFLISVFSANDPAENSGEEVTAYELLQNGLNEVEELEDNQLQAEMYVVLGEAYQSLGFTGIAADVMDRGIASQKEIYGEMSLEYASALYKRGLLERKNQNDDLALPYIRQAHQIRSEKLQEGDSKLIDSKITLAEVFRNTGKADSAEEVMRDILAEIDIPTYRESESHRSRLRDIYSSLAYVLREQGKLEEASKYYQEVITLLEMDEKENDLEAAAYYNNLAFVYRDLDDYEHAIEMLQKSLVINENIRGEGHPTTAVVRGNIAAIMVEQEDLDGALALYQKNLKTTEDYFGRNH